MSDLKLPSLNEITKKHFDKQSVIDLVSSAYSNDDWARSLQKVYPFIERFIFKIMEKIYHTFQIQLQKEIRKAAQIVIDLKFPIEVNDMGVHSSQNQLKIEKVSKDTNNEKVKEIHL